MQWFQLASALIAIVEATYKAITDALAAGRAPGDIHAAITDHVAELPGKIRAL